MTSLYYPTIKSLATHPLPSWLDDAKFGIFIHWGLYSIPAFAPLGANPDPKAPDMMRSNRYAEWYENTLKFDTSETASFHRAHYGDAPYSDFAPTFEAAAAALPAAEWADSFATAPLMAMMYAVGCRWWSNSAAVR
jgi:alpha-L-fucosidase